jgi:hypothetical protein
METSVKIVSVPMIRIRRAGLRENQEITGLSEHHRPGIFQRDLSFGEVDIEWSMVKLTDRMLL